MQLQPTNPTLGVNLEKLKNVFEDQKESDELDAVLRTLFNNLGSMQRVIAQVVNNNALETVLTANIPAASASRDNTMLIEDTGTRHNIIYYAGGLRYRITSGVAF